MEKLIKDLTLELETAKEILEEIKENIIESVKDNDFKYVARDAVEAEKLQERIDQLEKFIVITSDMEG